MELRAEYEAARAEWLRETREKVAAVEEAWRKKVEEARREHGEDLEILRDEQNEMIAACEKEKKEAVWQAKQELQSRYEDQLSGMLRTAQETKKAALAEVEEGWRKAREDLESEREAHELTRERLESKETELGQQRAAAERWRTELERLRAEKESAIAEAEARIREEIEALQRQHTRELTALQQQQFFRAAAFAKAYQDAGNPGTSDDAAARLGELIQEFVRDYSE